MLFWYRAIASPSSLYVYYKCVYIGVLCRKMKPTKKHRPAIWENLLGTVMAMNDLGETHYFDYDWDAAKAHAGVDGDSDPRLFKMKEHVRYSNGQHTLSDPQRGKLVLWIVPKKKYHPGISQARNIELQAE